MKEGLKLDCFVSLALLYRRFLTAVKRVNLLNPLRHAPLKTKFTVTYV